MTRVRVVITLWLGMACAGWVIHPVLPVLVEVQAAEPRAMSEVSGFVGEPSSLERGLFADAEDGHWDEHTLLQASLIASGIEEAEVVDQYVRRVEAIVRQFRRNESMNGTPHDRLRTIFVAMHREILDGGYRIEDTRLTRTLDRGTFNCVSATVMFHCLIERFGFKTTGLEVPGHAMSRVLLPDGALDIETTCPGWFDLLDDPKRQAELLEQTLGTRPHAGRRPEDRREISPVELVSMIYFNRGVDLLSEKQYVAAAASNAKALVLDPGSKTAWGNLLATLNNWAIDLGSLGRHAEAARRLEQGMAIDPTFETFQTNYLHVHYGWIEKQCRAGQFDDAMQLIRRARDAGCDKTWCDQAIVAVILRRARRAFDEGKVDESLRLLDLPDSKAVSIRIVSEAAVAEVNRWASNLLIEGRHAEAIELLDRALAQYADSRILSDNRRATVLHWAHRAFERGDSAEAIRRTTYHATPETLDPILLENLRYGYYQWISQLVAAGDRDAAQRMAQQATSDPFLAGRAALVIPRIP